MGQPEVPPRFLRLLLHQQPHGANGKRPIAVAIGDLGCNNQVVRRKCRGAFRRRQDPADFRLGTIGRYAGNAVV